MGTMRPFWGRCTTDSFDSGQSRARDAPTVETNAIAAACSCGGSRQKIKRGLIFQWIDPHILVDTSDLCGSYITHRKINESIYLKEIEMSLGPRGAWNVHHIRLTALRPACTLRCVQST